MLKLSEKFGSVLVGLICLIGMFSIGVYTIQLFNKFKTHNIIKALNMFKGYSASDCTNTGTILSINKIEFRWMSFFS